MNELLTWGYVASFGGMIAIVTTMTQVIKQYININPKWIALIATVAMQVLVQIFYYKDFSVNGIVLGVVNIFSVLLGAIGTHQTVIKPAKNMMQKGADNDA